MFDKDAPALARSMQVIRKERKLDGAKLVWLLVLVWLHHPQAGSSALSRFAGALGITISEQDIEEHWTFNKAEQLYEVLFHTIQCLVTTQALNIALLQCFAGVFIEDGSSILLPNVLKRYWCGCRGGNHESECTKASVKLTTRVDLVRGSMQVPMLQDGRSRESKSLLAATSFV